MPQDETTPGANAVRDVLDRVLAYVEGNFEHIDAQGRSLARHLTEVIDLANENADELERLLALEDHTHDGSEDPGGESLVHDHDADYEALGAVATHAAAGNPHPTYLTEAEADALYVELDQAEWTDLTDGGETALHSHAGGGAHPDLATHDALGLATDTELGNHTGDTSDAHDASAISYGGGTGMSATDVEAAIDELATEKSDTSHTHSLAAAWPVGSIYIAAVSTNPNTLLGFGTWSRFGEGRILVSQLTGDGDFDTAEETGGAKTHTHDAHATHTHAIQSPHSRSTGGSAYVDNVTDANASGTSATTHVASDHKMPYIVVYMWKRTA